MEGDRCLMGWLARLHPANDARGTFRITPKQEQKRSGPTIYVQGNRVVLLRGGPGRLVVIPWILCEFAPAYGFHQASCIRPAHHVVFVLHARLRRNFSPRKNWHPGELAVRSPKMRHLDESAAVDDSSPRSKSSLMISSAAFEKPKRPLLQ